MDIREVTQALRDATDTLGKMTLALTNLSKQNLELNEEVARLKIELGHWEDTYGTKTTPI